MSNIIGIRFKEIARPLRTTFSTALGQKNIMKSVIVEIVLKDGSSGRGECPTSFAIRGETIPAIKGIIREVTKELKGVPVDEYNDRIETFRTFYPKNPMTISGLETALFRASLAHQNISEHSYFGGRLRRIETDITVPFTTDSGNLKRWMNYVFKKKFTSYKLKVSGNMDDDKRLFSEVYSLLKNNLDTFTIRLDGNQGFTEKTCLNFFNFLARKNYLIELFEQPLLKDNYKGLKEIKKRSPVPIILDETVFNIVDLERVIADDLCHGINIKIAKSGIGGSLRLYEEAKKHGLKCMVGCMTETMVGLSAGIHFAAGAGGFDYIDLDAIHFLHHHSSYGIVDIVGAMYVVR